jgi:hypothetical protein
MQVNNKEMTQQEFDYSFALKRMMNDLAFVEEDLRQAKVVGIQGLSHGALRNIEDRLSDVKSAVVNGLKTVGM